jgi:hypothetical protein
MKLRREDDREAEFGLPTQFARPKDNGRDRVLNLASQGCTLRQIAMQTGLHKTQVQRMLKAGRMSDNEPRTWPRCGIFYYEWLLDRESARALFREQTETVPEAMVPNCMSARSRTRTRQLA